MTKSNLLQYALISLLATILLIAFLVKPETLERQLGLYDISRECEQASWKCDPLAKPRVFCWATLCEWRDEGGIDDEERAAGMEALRAAYSQLATKPTTHLGPAVLTIGRPWEAERMPIKEHYEPIYDARIMPPREFDHEYPGAIFINRANDLEIKERCKISGSKVACTYMPRAIGDNCFMWIVYDDILNYQRMSYDMAFRHERAHCNGWRHDRQGNTIK
jgi:hypothetical protein